MPVLLPLMVQISRSAVIIVGICQRQDFSSGVLVGDNLVGWATIERRFLADSFPGWPFFGIALRLSLLALFLLGKYIYISSHLFIYMPVVGHRLVRCFKCQGCGLQIVDIGADSVRGGS